MPRMAPTLKQPEVSVIISITLSHRDSITQGVHDYELIKMSKSTEKESLSPFYCLALPALALTPSPPSRGTEAANVLSFAARTSLVLLFPIFLQSEPHF